MRINTNMAALNAWRNMSTNEANVQKSLEKLSSGFRINRAADDAAGLAVSEKMRAQIRGTDMAVRNAQDGISLVQTAEGALTETHSILQRMRELSVQAASGTLNSDDSAQISTEFTQLQAEVNRIATDTKFNTKTLLDGSAGVVATAGGGSTIIKNITGTGDTQVTGGKSIGTTVVATAALASIDLSAGVTQAGAITLNGKTFNFTATDTAATIASALNAVSGDTGVSVNNNGGVLELTSTQVGSAGTITASGSGITAAGIAAKFGSTLAAGTLTGVTSTGVNAKLTGFTDNYEAQGNHVSITSGALKGMEFDVVSAAAETVSVTSNGSLKVQIGAEAGQQMNISISSMNTTALGINLSSVADQTSASAAITSLDNAIKQVSTQRAGLGAIQNRLEHTVNSLQVTSENLSSAESRIRDVDMAAEMANFTKNNILQQASQAMLAQANQSTQGILSLLR